MLNNDVFGANPLICRIPIVNYSSHVNLVESAQIHAPPISPVLVHLLDSEIEEPFSDISHVLIEKNPEASCACSEIVGNILDSENFDKEVAVEATNLIPNYLSEFKSSTTRNCSEIGRKLRSFSGYQEVARLDKTPPRKQWAHGRQVNLTEEVQLPNFGEIPSLRSIFNQTPIGKVANNLTDLIFKRKNTDGSLPLREPNIELVQINCGEEVLNFSRSERPAVNSVFDTSFETLEGQTDRFPIERRTYTRAVDPIVTRHPGQREPIDPITTYGSDDTSQNSRPNTFVYFKRSSDDHTTGVDSQNSLCQPLAAEVGTKNAGVSSRSSTNSSRSSLVPRRGRFSFLRFFSRPGTRTYGRRRGLPQSSKRNWKHFFFRSRKFRQLSKEHIIKHSSNHRVSEGTVQLGEITTTQTRTLLPVGKSKRFAKSNEDFTSYQSRVNANSRDTSEKKAFSRDIFNGATKLDQRPVQVVSRRANRSTSENQSSITHTTAADSKPSAVGGK